MPSTWGVGIGVTHLGDLWEAATIRHLGERKLVSAKGLSGGDAGSVDQLQTGIHSARCPAPGMPG